ncbi:MAG: M23 family metallopeptidase [Saprospiraceae bacterium]|nr:M23 family metallopeptidase [Saprospiraceae bacterium]MBK7789798.1 M23 family metallopeptidase [Saprospiraceae bacterium]MBK8112534.1 M23 family metallopeptidase [Saprospiraceae bacterium]MBK8850923.1 M23 family metallopeptidase [Saprospiraceae bacterium]MBL0081375.1 M23 family metallopeptidase [Saprospiraceae bacterium]
MKHIKYVFNERTLQFEKHTSSRKQILIKFSGIGLAIVFTSVSLFLLGMKLFPSPSEKALYAEVEMLKSQINTMDQDFDKLADNLTSLHEKDNQVHRLIFGVNPIDSGVWNGGVGGHDKYSYLNSYASSGEYLKKQLVKVDNLKRKFGIQQKSLDSLYTIALKREKRLASIPSIKPVQADKLKKDLEYLSGFGIRLHPLHKVRKFHKGIDFTAPTGTKIQATGDGRVVKVEKGGRGYGNCVTIDHGFGFKTLYAHMLKISVKQGQMVKKGQMVGLVGNTGTSTAPHLHYEVHVNGSAVNPINYVLDGLTPMEYRDLVIKSGQENQSWD